MAFCAVLDHEGDSRADNRNAQHRASCPVRVVEFVYAKPEWDEIYIATLGLAHVRYFNRQRESGTEIKTTCLLK